MLSKLRHIGKYHPLLLISLGSILIFAGAMWYALIQTQQALHHAQSFNFSVAQTHANRAIPIVSATSAITLGKQPDIETWKNGLLLVDEAAQLADAATSFMAAYAHQLDQPADIGPVAQRLAQLQLTLSGFQETLPRARLLQPYLPDGTAARLDSLEQYLSSAATLTSSLTQTDQTWILLFQNSNELRATGGFTGSYALLEIQDGVVLPLVIEDIYDADGQFVGFVSPPPGIREYTSGNRGLRLPDANWWPDFPKSAEVQLQFFELGNKGAVAGIVSVNLSLLEDLLTITGPVELLDYNLTLTAENAADVLRTDRESFFPGSSQKKNLISHAATMIRQQLLGIDREQVVQLQQLLSSVIPQKDIQAFAIDPRLQTQLASLGITGEIGTASPHAQKLREDCQCALESYMLVESNVGINKANSAITRSVELSWDDHEQLLETEIRFVHDGSYIPAIPGENAGYVNYQRLIFPTSYTLQDIQVNNQPIPRYDLAPLTTHQGEELQQLGFVVPIPSGSTQRVNITLERSAPYTSGSGLLIHKQSGLTPTPYTISTPHADTTTLLDSDTPVLLVP